jgi:hypothetical protein
MLNVLEPPPHTVGRNGSVMAARMSVVPKFEGVEVEKFEGDNRGSAFTRKSHDV